MWFSTVLKTFNNYDIILTNITNNLRMNKCGAVFPVTNFELIQQSFLKVLKISEFLLFLNILKEKLVISYLVDSFNLKTV